MCVLNPKLVKQELTRINLSGGKQCSNIRLPSDLINWKLFFLPQFDFITLSKAHENFSKALLCTLPISCIPKCTTCICADEMFTLQSKPLDSRLKGNTLLNWSQLNWFPREWKKFKRIEFRKKRYHRLMLIYHYINTCYANLMNTTHKQTTNKSLNLCLVKGREREPQSSKLGDRRSPPFI